MIFRAPKNHSERQAFTLIELLVVVAIISLLLAIVLPALRKTKEQAKLLVCKTHLKQLGIALQSYATGNQDKPILSNSGGHSDLWVEALTVYLDGASEVLYCPKANLNPQKEFGAAFDAMTVADLGVDHKLAEFPEYGGWSWSGNAKYIWKRASVSSSYAYNGWLYAEPKNGWSPTNRMFENGFKKITNVSATATVPVFGGSVWADAWPTPADLPGPTTTWAKGSLNGIDNTQYMSRFLLDRHQKRIGMVFLDGHTDTINCEDGQLWTLRWSKKWAIPSEAQMKSIKLELSRVPAY